MGGNSWRPPRTRQERLQRATESMSPGSRQGGVAMAQPVRGRPLKVGGATEEIDIEDIFDDESNQVLFLQETFTLTASIEKKHVLLYEPIQHSEHVYWNGVYQPQSEWTRSGNIVTLLDSGSLLASGDLITVEYAYHPQAATDAALYGTLWRHLKVTEFDGPTGTGRETVSYDDSAWTTINLPFGKNDATPMNITDPPWLEVVGDGTPIEFADSVWLRRDLAGISNLWVRHDGIVTIFLNGVQIASYTAGGQLDAKAEVGPLTLNGPGVLAIFCRRKVRGGYDGHYYDFEIREV